MKKSHRSHPVRFLRCLLTPVLLRRRSMRPGFLHWKTDTLFLKEKNMDKTGKTLANETKNIFCVG